MLEQAQSVKRGNRPPAVRPASESGVAQNTESRACSRDPAERTFSAILSSVAASDGRTGSARISATSTSLTSGLKPPWARLPKA